MTEKLTPHFTDTELACRCGCGMLPKQELLDALEAARLIYGRPIHIASGARCEEHNRDVGGAPDSAHTRGTAVDPSATNINLGELITAFFAAGFYGFGMGMKGGKRMLHFDVDEKHGPRAWMY